MKKHSKATGLKCTSLMLYLLSISVLFLPLQAHTLELIQTQTQAQAQKQPQPQPKEAYYISPELQLGLHTQASLDSPIKTLISSGTAVEVIKVDKEFTQIKTTDGLQGWVKNKFLSKEEPASLQVEKMQTALLRAQQFMKDRLQDEQTKKTSSTSTSQLSDNEKAFYKETISGLKEELNAWEQLDQQDKQAQQLQAEKTNRRLKEKLTRIASLATGQDMDSSHFNFSIKDDLPGIKNNIKQTFLKLIRKDYILLLIMAGLGFFLGLFLMDLINRRRHGGYRI